MLFLHLPKTGGTWVTRALAAAGVPTTPLRVRNAEGPTDHAALVDLSLDPDVFTFAFVRHPLDWWRSNWVHRMRYGWQGDPIGDRIYTESFDEYIAAVLEHTPGRAGETFESFVGTADREISFVGRYESLADDLVRALRLGDEPHNEDALRATPPANLGHYQRWRAAYRPELAAALAEAERPIIERFYADDPIPATLLASPTHRGRRAAPRLWYEARARVRRMRARP